MRPSKLTAAVVLDTLVSVAACGGSGGSPTNGPASTQAAGQPTAAGGGPTAATGGDRDQCALLSLADIKTAVGIDYPAGVVDTTGLCNWTATGGTYSSVSVGIDSKTTYAATKAGFPGGTETTVSGHPAYGLSGSILETIWVDLGGGSVLTVIVAPAPENAPAVVKQLAEAAIAKM